TIVYLNAACATWLNHEPGELIGRPCRYQSGDADSLAAAADGLAPPPEVFHGQLATGLIAAHRADGSLERRRARFVPLAGDDDGVAGVVAIVEATAAEDDATVAPASSDADSDEAQRLHEIVRTFRQELAARHHPERLAGNSSVMR